MASRRLRIALVLIGAVLWSSCAQDGSREPLAVGYGEPPPLVEVEMRNVAPVLVVDGVVLDNPTIAVLAPTSGVLRTAVDPSSIVGADDQIATVGDASVNVPAAGEILEWVVPAGAAVGVGTTVALLHVTSLAVTARIPAEVAYRVLDEDSTARVQLEGGPAPFDCLLVALAVVSGDDTTGSAPSATCLIPPDIAGARGLSATLAIVYDERPTTLALPVTAVAGRIGRGQVELVDASGEHTIVDVELGTTDGVYVEILSGLEIGDTVSSFAPNLRVGSGS